LKEAEIRNFLMLFFPNFSKTVDNSAETY